MLHFHMDASYLITHQDQVEIISKIAEKYPSLYKFANYHNPIYPSCIDPAPNSNDNLIIIQGMKYWVPLFDKYNFVASFEHHNHFRKITHRIRNDKNDTNGMRYVGDGCWGVSNWTCDSDGLYKP